MLETSPDEKLIAQLFSNQPDSIVWFMPVFSNGKRTDASIIDFEAKYCNSAVSKNFSITPEKVLGSRLNARGFMNTIHYTEQFEHCLHVWRTGEPLEFTYYDPRLDKHFNVQQSKVMNGILSIARDRTKEVRAEIEQKKQALLLNKILNASPTCIVLCQAVRNPSGRIEDFKLLMVNDKIANDLKLPKEEIIKQTYCSIHPSVRNNGLIGILSDVVETGKPFKNEIYLEVFGGWFLLSADKVDDDKVLAIYLDINETKNQNKKLEQQAQWYNNILEHSTNGIIALQSVRNSDNEVIDFEIKLCNPSGIKMGSLPEDAVGKRLCDLLPQVKQTGYFDLHKQVIETGKPYKNILPFNWGNGEGWYQVSLSKLEDGLVSNFMDVSELKHHEKIIQEQASVLNLILNSSINGVYMLQAIRNDQQEIIDFKFIHVNEIVCKQAGRTKEEILGKSYLKTFPHTKASGVFDRNCEILKTGEEYRSELHYKGDGVDMWFDTSVSKVGEDKIVVAFNDITALKHAAVQLELSNEDLRRSNDRLTEFTHIASHDLNEPLRKIQTFTNLLKERYSSPLHEEGKDYLERINKTANRMQSLINDLLLYSRVSNSINRFELIHLEEIVKEVQNDLEASIQKKNAKLILSALPNIKGDKTQLRQIFQNLISNAIKFQPKGNVPQVHIRNKGAVVKRGKCYFAVEVEDNGIGIAEMYQEKIFHLFQRLHGKNEFEGTGIGLAIVQRAMENHNGFIEVKSEPEKGSCFTLLFPQE